jgi:hypothetical protein
MPSWRRTVEQPRVTYLTFARGDTNKNPSSKVNVPNPQWEKRNGAGGFCLWISMHDFVGALCVGNTNLDMELASPQKKVR